MEYRAQLIALAEAFGAATQRSEARVATMAAKDGKFFRLVRAGKGCTVDTYLAIKQWFADNWPAELPWPEGVDRPGVLPNPGSGDLANDAIDADVAAAAGGSAPQEAA